MGVYIHGMEMPKRGHTITITIVGSGEAYVEYFDCRPHVEETIEYTAVPIPPHGRLVDMGEIEERIDSCCDDIDCSKTMCNECAVQIVMTKVFDAPTSIPAEEGET